MSYKCLECGHVFEHDEVYRWRESHGEEMTGCPVCGCAFEEAQHCKVCHGDYLEDELFSGVCRDCLLETMTAETLADYLWNGELAEDFYIEVLFDKELILSLLQSIFVLRVSEESRKGKTDTLQKCRAYVHDDDTGLRDYAQWLFRDKAVS